MATIEIAPRITVDPAVRSGKPVIKGTRVPVSLVIAQLAGGATMEDVIEDFKITVEDVRAALAYTAALLEDEVLLASA